MDQKRTKVSIYYHSIKEMHTLTEWAFQKLKMLNKVNFVLGTYKHFG